MSITFQTSDTRQPNPLAMTKSLCQARNITKGSVSTGISLAIYPLWGFGTFSSSFNPNHFDQLKYNTTWPFVYNKLTVTAVTPSGTSTGTQTYQTTVDNQIVTSPGGLPGYGSPILDYTITDSLITIHYGDAGNPSTYTAQLSGTILDNTLPGPFNPADDWEILTTRCMALLDICPLPILQTGIQSNWIQPLSFSPGYGILAQGTGTGLIMAAARGLPMYGVFVSIFLSQFRPPFAGSGSITNIQITEPPGATNADWPNPYNVIVNPPSFYGNFGAVVCAKSSWTLTGKGPVKNVNGFPNLQSYVSSNSHLSIYKQPWIPIASGIGFAPGAPGAVLKTYMPSSKFFDAKAYFNPGEYGVLGFLSGAS